MFQKLKYFAASTVRVCMKDGGNYEMDRTKHEIDVINHEIDGANHVKSTQAKYSLF